MDKPPAPPSHSGHLRVARSPLHSKGETPPPDPMGRYSLYFNVTVFGEELHLRLQPKRQLVVPGAPVEWQEDFQELFRQPLQRECVYTGGITGMPGAAVAISNCDGLVRDKPSSRCILLLTLVPELGQPIFLLGSSVFGTSVGTLWDLGQVRGCAAFQREPHMPYWPPGSHSVRCEGTELGWCLTLFTPGTTAHLAGVPEPRHIQG